MLYFLLTFSEILKLWFDAFYSGYTCYSEMCQYSVLRLRAIIWVSWETKSYLREWTETAKVESFKSREPKWTREAINKFVVHTSHQHVFHEFLCFSSVPELYHLLTIKTRPSVFLTVKRDNLICQAVSFVCISGSTNPYQLSQNPHLHQDWLRTALAAIIGPAFLWSPWSTI